MNDRLIIFRLIVFVLLLIKLSIATMAITQTDDFKYVEDFIEAKEGEIFKVINKDNFDLRLYVFTDVNACFVSQSNIPDILKILSLDGKKVESVLFFSSTKAETAKEIAKSNNWEYEVIADYNNLYSDYYKIKKLPSFIILDSKGKVLFADKLGGAKSTNEKLINISNSVTKFESIDKRIMKTIVLKNEKYGNIFTSHIRKINFNSNDSTYLIGYDYETHLYKFDKSGKLIIKYEINEWMQENQAENMIDYSFYDNYKKFVANLNTKGVIQHLFYYDLEKKKQILFNLDSIRNKFDSLKGYIEIAFNEKNNNLYLSLRPVKKSIDKLLNPLNPITYKLLKLNKNLNFEKLIPMKFSIGDRSVSAFSSECLPFINNDKLYVTSMFADEVFGMDEDGEIEKTYKVVNSKYYRYNPEGMKNIERNEYSFFRGRASINYNVLFDKTQKKLYLYFQNLTTITNENIKLSLRNPKENVLIELTDDINANPEEYLLPNEHEPFYIDNGIVHTTTNEDGLRLYHVKLK